MEVIRTSNSAVSGPTLSRTASILRSISKQRQLFFILVIPLAVYLLFEYLPMLKLRWAFTNFGEVPQSQVSYVGLNNFIRLIHSASFMNAFKNTLIISAMKLVFGFPIPIIIALMLNEINARLFKKTVQTIIYFPHFFSWVVIGSIWFLILAPQNSVNSQIATLTGVEPVYWFASKEHIRELLVLTDIWAGAGYAAIVYLAAITSVDPTLYEAAKVDGAGKISQIWHITLASIRPTIVIMLIFELGKILNIFDQVLIMAAPVVYETADVIQTYAYRTGISEMKIGYGMAVSIFKAAIGFTLVLITNRFARKINDEGVF
ncbi:ABC transporter permease [Paenibacillus montanisoli]|uniref:Sugar ABC transporter permease n=1 Tax=Paenibacillus montanisoli TaxID=2081970 RepID=A0A328TZW7_9BACL|nr:ABC transporter permease subunit [Paenibacillus montanisoli]RAP74731.1 sugar ABC transporter permease [Paenibacillus montanisoli]